MDMMRRSVTTAILVYWGVPMGIVRTSLDRYRMDNTIYWTQGGESFFSLLN